MSPVINDNIVVITIVTVFLLSVVLSYPLTRVVVGQESMTTNQICFFTSGVLHPIVRLVPNEGLTLTVTVGCSVAMS
jgi:hypothetical protein